MSSKVMFMLGFALVTLGFLISTTMNMYGDMQHMQDELDRLRSANIALIQEKNVLNAKNLALQQTIAQWQNGNTPKEVVCPSPNQAGVAPVRVGFVTALTVLGIGRLIANRIRVNG